MTPATRSKTRHVVARVADLPPGRIAKVTAGNRTLCLVNRDGRFHALADRCPHAGGSLADGSLVGTVESDGPGSYRLCRQGQLVRCPWHGWAFDLETGHSWCDSLATRVRTFDTTIVHGEDLTRGPYEAETFDVTVDGDYVVVEL